MTQGRTATVVDIGANHGLYSLYAASLTPRVKVIAIEPQYELSQFVRISACMNGWFDRVEVLHGAVGQSIGTSTINVPKGLSERGTAFIESPGVAKVLPKELIRFKHTTTTPVATPHDARVPTRPIHAWIDLAVHPYIDVLKIDVVSE